MVTNSFFLPPGPLKIPMSFKPIFHVHYTHSPHSRKAIHSHAWPPPFIPTSSSSLSRLNQWRHWGFSSLHPSHSSASSFSSLSLRGQRLRLHLHLQRSAASQLRRRQHLQQRRLLKLPHHELLHSETEFCPEKCEQSLASAQPPPRLSSLCPGAAVPAPLFYAAAGGGFA